MPASSLTCSEVKAPFVYMSLNLLAVTSVVHVLQSPTSRICYLPVRVSDPHPFLADPDLENVSGKQMWIWIGIRIRIQGLIFKGEKEKKLFTFFQKILQL